MTEEKKGHWDTEKFDKLLTSWRREGASDEFMGFAETALKSFMQQVSVSSEKERSFSNTCDAVVQIMGMMITDLAVSAIGTDKKQGPLFMDFFNRFMFELAKDLNDTLEDMFDHHADIQEYRVNSNATKH